MLQRTPTSTLFPYTTLFRSHHIWNVPFFFEMGAFRDASGTVVHGDINRFFAGDPTAGILAGAFLFKMFGLPAAAIDRKSTRLNSSHVSISYAVFCLKKKKK